METTQISTIYSKNAVDYSVDETFDDKIKECLKSIKAINFILIRFKPSNKNYKLHLEIEYTKVMITMIFPILNSFISEVTIEDYKKKILLQIENLKIFIETLRTKFNLLNTKYFSEEETFLFLRNFEILLKSEAFIKTKTGLTFLRYLLYYIQKLENNVIEIHNKDFYLTNEEILKYSFKQEL